MASSDSEENLSDVPREPVQRKRGRPAKIPEKTEDVDEQEEQDDDTEVEPPKVKRSPGRPKGSKNKTHKEKLENTGPKRPRGRPRKWPVVEKPPGPKRKRGRPKKNPEPTSEATDQTEQS